MKDRKTEQQKDNCVNTVVSKSIIRHMSVDASDQIMSLVPEQ